MNGAAAPTLIPSSMAVQSSPLSRHPLHQRGMARLGFWYTDACKWLPGVASGDPDVYSGPPVHVPSSFFFLKKRGPSQLRKIPLGVLALCSCGDHGLTCVSDKKGELTLPCIASIVKKVLIVGFRTFVSRQSSELSSEQERCRG